MTNKKERLAEILGNNESFRKGSRKMMTQAFDSKASVEMSNVLHLPFNMVCPRFSNKYINDPKTTKALAKSIEKNGLLQPILVVEIDNYLNNSISDDEKEYLKNMSEKYGCRYFISSGHRRYKAMLTNALGKDVETQEDIIDFYESLLKKDIYKEISSPLLTGEEREEAKKYFIPCRVMDPKFANDQDAYNDTNLTSRATTTFELLVNTLDMMNEKEPSVSEIRTFIRDRYGIEVSDSTLYNNLGIYTAFKEDERYMNAIYDGKITTKEAKTLKPIFNKIDKDEVIKTIYDGTFNVNALKKSLTKSKGRPVSRKYSKAEVLDLLNQIKLKNITVDEAMKQVSNGD